MSQNKPYKPLIHRTPKQAALLEDRHARGALHEHCNHDAFVRFPSLNIKMCADCRVELHADGSYL